MKDIKIAHGKIFGDGSPHGIQVFVIDKEAKLSCSLVTSVPWLKNISKKRLDNLFDAIEVSYLVCSNHLKKRIP